MTKMLKPSNSSISLAADLIKSGEIVAFPTETVYGLGANALDEKAVSNIFKAKGRPSDNPLIIHIAKKSDVLTLAKSIPKKAKVLVDKFWPGAITIILKKKECVPSITCANLDTVAIRMPKHNVALSIIKKQAFQSQPRQPIYQVSQVRLLQNMFYLILMDQFH